MKKSMQETLIWTAVLIIAPGIVFFQMQPDTKRPEVEPPGPHALARLLEPGETNPPLTWVGTNWPLPDGAKLYFCTNQTSYGTVLRCKSNFLKAHDEAVRAVRVKWGDGKEDWILFDYLEKNYYSLADGD